MALQSANITVMASAARKAGRFLARDFGEVEHLQISRKGPADFVSLADTKAEQTIVAELKRARPGYGFLLEEGGELAGTDSEHRWIIDPLDGTTNFLHGLPHFAISIALERAGQIVAGIVYQPLTDELFWAERGRGAYLNSKRLRVSGRRDLNQSVIATGIPFLGRGDHKAYLGELEVIMAEVAGIRRFGAASLDLAYLAAGRFDGFWESGLSSWDIAAGILLVQEAGGSVTEFNNQANMLVSGEVLASNNLIHGPLMRLLRNARQNNKPSV
ncbi:inositol monophosphatase family protein [Govanella unica]|uniref:Inositol-1-monophosphatase n=1 Tax=Govanella unica TaxID=2975056 RepID=A0A9X3TZY7_9PROT|nr:inositol monophosphatase family protein [Govania unica]MDA5194894.1 inositol monophosphatase [Govania unica]